MSSALEQLDLAGDFEPASEADWRTLVEKTLKSADFDKRMVSRTSDGIALQPLYQQSEAGRTVTGATSGMPWRISQRVDHPDPALANTLALADLEGGAGSLTIVPTDAGLACGYGIVLNTVADVSAALAGVALDMIDLRLEPSPSGKRLAAMLAAYVAHSGHDASKLKINFGLDPISVLMRGGSLAVTPEDLARDHAATISDLRARGFAGPLVTCDVRPVHEAGGSEAQELAIALASGVAYLRSLESQGYSLADAEGCLSWTIAIDADQFLGLAKLRALRLLWARIQEASGLAQRPIPVHAETAWRMMSRRDPAVNMLRTTMATATASIAGADSIQVLPYTLPLGLPNAFARRVARNTQMVLAEESNLWRVADPAAGSGAYEAITDQLCETAWAAFQEIEAEGGLITSLSAGALQSRIASVREARAQDIARRKLPLTGTSEFPNIAETDETVLDVPNPAAAIPKAQRGGDQAMPFSELVQRFASGATLAELTAQPATTLEVAALPSQRLSEPFETLREAADRATSRSGARPAVFLANLGPLAEHGTRATWIRNLLAAGGLDATSNDGFTNSADAGKAFSESGCRIACICGTDETYANLAEATAGVLKQAGASKVYLAGRPGDLEASLRDAGIDEFLYAGINVITALSAIQEALDVD